LSVILYGSGTHTRNAWYVDMTPEEQVTKLEEENAAMRAQTSEL
jgi:hypothetical protein